MAVLGGGRVIFAPGQYLSGGIELRTGVMPYLPQGAELQGSTQYLTDYPNRAFIFADGIECAGIIGEGTVNGNGGHPQVLAQDFRVNDGNQLFDPSFRHHATALITGTFCMVTDVTL